MGHSKRKSSQLIVELRKKYKKKLYSVAEIMPNGFSDRLFIQTFEKIFPNEWSYLNKYYEYYQKQDQYLLQKNGKERHGFPKPHRFILNASFHLLNKMRKRHTQLDAISSDEFVQKKAELIKNNIKKQEKRQRAMKGNTKFIQNVTPEYLYTLEKEYFRTMDLKRKLDIVKELSKYKNNLTVSILHKVNSREKDYFLRQQAFFALQKMGEVVFLRRRKKGKRRDDVLLKEYNGFTLDLNKKPADIIMEFSANTIQLHKQYDVFLCHSSKDHQEVLESVEKLNKQGFVVYVDWVSDREDLKRENSNKHTAEVIKQRLRQSKCLMYVYSHNGETSRWVPWEIGYFDAYKGKVCVLSLPDVDDRDKVEYIEGYPDVYFEKNGDVVVSDYRKVNLREWFDSTGIYDK